MIGRVVDAITRFDQWLDRKLDRLVNGQDAIDRHAAYDRQRAIDEARRRGDQ